MGFHVSDGIDKLLTVKCFSGGFLQVGELTGSCANIRPDWACSSGTGRLQNEVVILAVVYA